MAHSIPGILLQRGQGCVLCFRILLKLFPSSQIVFHTWTLIGNYYINMELQIFDTFKPKQGDFKKL